MIDNNQFIFFDSSENSNDTIYYNDNNDTNDNNTFVKFTAKNC